MTDDATTRRAQAHRLGTLEAEQLDQALRALERRDRQVIAAAPPPPPPPPVETAQQDAEFERLSAAYRLALEDVARLDGFRRNVERSLPWRILQTMRRPFGRSW